MAIRATCDGCFMEYTVANDKAGKAFKCKECGSPVRVPGPGQSSAAPPAAAAPPRQRAPAGSGKPAAKKKKKRSSSSSGTGVVIGAVVASLAVLGVVGYLLMPQGGGNAAGTEAGSVTGNAAVEAVPVVKLSADEESLLAEFQKTFREQMKATPEERKAATEKFAAEHNTTPAELLALLKKNSSAQEAANNVDSQWQPLKIGKLSGPSWPTEAHVSVPVEYSGARFSIPELRTPYLLTSATITGGTQRHVFDLATSREIGHWTNSIVASHTEQISQDGKLVCLQEGFTPPISLHVVDAASGQTLHTIVSPDVLRVANMAFVGPTQLMVLTPMGTEGASNPKQGVLIFDAKTGKEVSRFDYAFQFAGAERMSVSPDGRYLVATGKGKSIEVVDLHDGKQVCALDLKEEGFQFGQLHSVAFSPDGRQIAVLEQQPLTALRLYVIDAASGTIAHRADMYGSPTNLGAPLELQMQHPLVWFPDARHVLIGKIAALDTTTGRRVWQAQGGQLGTSEGRLPATAGLLYQVNTEKESKLATLPIDFERIAATQAEWPADAVLAPGMTVDVWVDLSGGGLSEVDAVVATGLGAKLEGLGFTVTDGADRVLRVDIREGAVAFSWLVGSDVVWESIATADTAMVPQLGHMRGEEVERALRMEGIVKVQAYPVPYFIAADRQFTLPVVDRIDHGE